jgi:hypothetical protein
MSVLGDFESMRLYRTRAAEFERLAGACLVADEQYRYHLIARRYSELADMVERSDKARVTQHLETLRAMREEIAQRGAHAVSNRCPLQND